MDLTPDLGALRYPVTFLVALALSLYFTPIIRRGAIKYGVVDAPDGKLKQHGEPVAYLGGVSIYLSFLFALAFTYDFNPEVIGLLLGSSIVVMLGLFDDLKVLTPLVKLAGQIVAALVLVKAGIMTKLDFLPPALNVLLTVVWLVGITNAINLIDVSDGLAAGVASIAGMFFYVISVWNNDNPDNNTPAVMMLALVGATLGFLAYNRPPAKIFLGDAGSLLLGFLLGAVAMTGRYTVRHPLAAIAPVAILGVPIFDTLFVMGARLARGLPLMHGSPDHFAVRMRNHGVRAGIIALIAYIGGALLGGAALAICRFDLEVAIVLVVMLALATGGVVLRLWRIGRSPAERAAPRQDGEQEQNHRAGPEVHHEGPMG
jgi:UDP-GlcNAc:undecaprenyl-phosphate/decaprenyl-phosphate GlcNAc-1-phosphate transferase